jgi:hypothetical protein
LGLQCSASQFFSILLGISVLFTSFGSTFLKDVNNELASPGWPYIVGVIILDFGIIKESDVFYNKDIFLDFSP